MRVVLLLLTLFVVTSAYAEDVTQAAKQNPIQWDQFNEDDLRILQVKLGKYELEDVITAYQTPDGLYIPLGVFSQITGLAIKVNPDKGFAEGFILDESRHFILDGRRREITISGKTSVLDKDDIKLRQDDIYLAESVYQKFFPVKIDVDLYASYIFIKPTEPFPLQKRKEREEKIEKIKSRHGNIARHYPEIPTDYKPYDVPFIDQSLGLSVKQDPLGDVTSSLSYSTYMTSDLANMESSLYLSGTSDEALQSYRLSFSKHDPDAGLLGGLAATSYSFGSVNLIGTDLVSNNETGLLGATVSNFPTNQQLNFDKHTFQGDLLPGWQVELYQNNALIGYITEQDTRSSSPTKTQYYENGQYVFEDIPLLFGSNYFRLVFYGPHGETKEENYSFVLNQSLTKAGQYHYRVGMAADDTLPGNHSQVHYDYGLNKYLTAQANVSSLPLPDGQQHDYLSMGLAGFSNSIFAKLNSISDTAGGSALDLTAQSRIFGINVSLDYATLDNFLSEAYYYPSNRLINKSSVRLDTAIPKTFLPRLPLTFEYKTQEFENGNTHNEFSNRISSYANRLAITNELRSIEDSISGSSQSGLLQISSHQYRYTVRGDIYYDIAPKSQVSSIALSYTGKNLGAYYFDLGISHTNDYDQYLFGVHKTRGKYAFDVNLSSKTNGEIALTTTMSTNFGYDRRKENWFNTSRPIASKGAASLDVFLDENGNRIHDPEEKGLDNVTLEVNGVRKPDTTGEDGTLLLTELPIYEHVDFSVASDSLADPLWIPEVPGINAVLRPGYVLQYSFPIMQTGEVDGTVYLKDAKGKTKAVGDVVLEVVDSDGKVVSTAKSAYDGFYVLSKIPVGDYSIRVSQKQLDRLGIRANSRSIKLTQENLFYNGIDLIVQRR